MPIDQPTIGRIVHYTPQSRESGYFGWDGRQWPAMVTAVNGGLHIALTVFPPAGLPYCSSTGIYDADGATAGSWRWPPRA